MKPNEKYLKLLMQAELLESSKDWQLIYQQVLGLEGTIQTLTLKERAEFEGSSCHREILQLMAKLRETWVQGEATRVITVRLPKSIHESLRVEAYEKHTSLNQLCISKLLQPISSELVPRDSSSNHTTRRA
jgi:hypothetical protein